MKIKKEDALAFLGALAAALVTTIVTRVQNKNDISETVKAVLAEERKQIAAATEGGVQA